MEIYHAFIIEQERRKCNDQKQEYKGRRKNRNGRETTDHNDRAVRNN